MPWPEESWKEFPKKIVMKAVFLKLYGVRHPALPICRWHRQRRLLGSFSAKSADSGLTSNRTALAKALLTGISERESPDKANVIKFMAVDWPPYVFTHDIVPDQEFKVGGPLFSVIVEAAKLGNLRYIYFWNSNKMQNISVVLFYFYLKTKVNHFKLFNFEHNLITKFCDGFTNYRFWACLKMCMQGCFAV